MSIYDDLRGLRELSDTSKDMSIHLDNVIETLKNISIEDDIEDAVYEVSSCIEKLEKVNDFLY